MRLQPGKLISIVPCAFEVRILVDGYWHPIVFEADLEEGWAKIPVMRPDGKMAETSSGPLWNKVYGQVTMMVIGKEPKTAEIVSLRPK